LAFLIVRRPAFLIVTWLVFLIASPAPARAHQNSPLAAKRRFG
jgi:hypothetical protein